MGFVVGWSPLLEGWGVMIGLGIVTKSIYNWIITVNGSIPSYGIWDESSNHDSKIWPLLSIIVNYSINYSYGGLRLLIGIHTVWENQHKWKYQIPPVRLQYIHMGGGGHVGEGIYSQTGSGSITIVTYLRKISSGTSKFSWKIHRFQLILRGPADIPLSSPEFKKKNIQKPIKNLPKYHSTLMFPPFSHHVIFNGLV